MSTMITRRNLAEQLRDYQLRSQRDWSSLSFWTSITRGETTSTRRQSFTLIILFFIVAGALYYKDVAVGLYFLGTGLGLLALWQTIGRRLLAKRRQRRLLP